MKSDCEPMCHPGMCAACDAEYAANEASPHPQRVEACKGCDNRFWPKDLDEYGLCALCDGKKQAGPFENQKVILDIFENATDVLTAKREVWAKECLEWNKTHDPQRDPVASLSQYGKCFIFNGRAYERINPPEAPVFCHGCGAQTPQHWDGTATCVNPLATRIGLRNDFRSWLIGRRHPGEGAYDPEITILLCPTCVPRSLELIREMSKPAQGHTNKRTR